MIHLARHRANLEARCSQCSQVALLPNLLAKVRGQGGRRVLMFAAECGLDDVAWPGPPPPLSVRGFKLGTTWLRWLLQCQAPSQRSLVPKVDGPVMWGGCGPYSKAGLTPMHKMTRNVAGILPCWQRCLCCLPDGRERLLCSRLATASQKLS